MIHVQNLSYRYNNGSEILKGLSFTIKDGEFVAIIGQNGAGKTTLLKHFNGLLKPTAGRVLVNNLDVAKTKTSQLARQIGFLFQNPDHQIFCPTVYEEIAFGLKNLGINHSDLDMLVRQAAEKVGISTYLQCNPFSLSKGQRQRVALASVLAVNTENLVLDEPTTGLDYQEGIAIMEIIKKLNEEGKTIIIVTHDMELVARYAKRVIILKNGEVLQDGPTKKVLSKTASLAASGLQPPQIYLLAEKFHKQGLFNDVYTVEEMFNAIMFYLGSEKNAGLR
ncbi:MAG: energy-coupling factor transporter ATPase [Firmicutes bacterium]|nr:energy-coupling factor transporter ATPase [Bacillota bacterium]